MVPTCLARGVRLSGLEMEGRPFVGEAARRRQQQLYNKLEEAACQKRLHDEHHQCLLDERATQACHEALLRRQCLIAEAATLE